MSTLSAEAIEAARAAMGRTEKREQTLDSESLRRFAVAIGGSGDLAQDRPVLAHWAWFLPGPTDAEIGPDGHPARGGFMPAIEALPRRMFASTTIRFTKPLELEASAVLTTRIADVRHKAGRSGDLVFVDVERTIAQRDAVCLTELQTLVYRAAGESAPQALPVPEPNAALVPSGGEVWTPNPVNLFRFSAVTFNGHRIHYDLPYATEVEGYPGLIVHGPFIASRLAELAGRGGTLASFTFRAQAPCFVDQPIRLASAGEGKFQAIRCDGAVATLAEATYA